jgi:hypothetical protein
MGESIEVTDEGLRAFRARRGMLRGEGAPDLTSCAHRLLGAQAQVEACALHALAMRTAGATVDDVSDAIATSRALVRTWGQRGTLHLYAAQDLPLVCAVSSTWATSGRRGGMPSVALVDRFAEIFEAAGEPLVRSDLEDEVPQSYVDALTDHPGAGGNPRRFGVTRLIWALARRGDVVFALRQGKEQAYAHRRVWLPALEWEEWEADAAHVELARRYLRAFGPASWRDLAYHFGAKMSDVKRWKPDLEPDLVEVSCEGRGELFALAEDADALREDPREGDWPLRLLPAYDTKLMGHRDKRVVLPDADEEKLVWKKAAVVAAAVLHEGRFVGTWAHKKKSKTVDVTLSPLGGWDDDLEDAAREEAARFAGLVGRELGAFEVGG